MGAAQGQLELHPVDTVGVLGPGVRDGVVVVLHEESSVVIGGRLVVVDTVDLREELVGNLLMNT